MKLRWPHSYFKKHKRLPYLLIILIPAALYFVHQGQRYYEGRQVLRALRNIHSASEWYQYGADRDVKEAQYNLGLLYRRGFTVPQSDADAAKWMRKASDQDMALAQNELGTYYEHGIGIPKDTAEAAKLYKKAANHGYAPAMNHLAGLMLSGNGVAEDQGAAAKLFERSASAGFIPAQLNLARVYERGIGVVRDPVKAYAWIAVADAATDETAYQTPIDQAAKRLLQSMNEKNRIIAKAMAETYMNEYGERTRGQFLNAIKAPPAIQGTAR